MKKSEKKEKKSFFIFNWGPPVHAVTLFNENAVFWPIPCHVCYSLDSIFCKQLRKLSIINDIHILVYYLQ